VTNQPTLFDQARVPQYPFAPASGVTDTSREAAAAIAETAEILRAKALEIFKRGAYTPDEVAGMLGVSVLAMRPRCTELREQGLIVRTGERRKNKSGCTAWVLTARESDP
jgi:predicted ArsR family transcriptional regulator